MAAILRKEAWTKRLKMLKCRFQDACRALSGQSKNLSPAAWSRDLGSFEEYQAWLESADAEISRRLDLLKLLEKLRTPGGESSGIVPAGYERLVTPGFCFCCKNSRDFETPRQPGLTPNWREGLICPTCFMNSRMRSAVHLLEASLKPSKNARIYLTEQVTTLFRHIAAKYPASVGSEYLRDGTGRGQVNARGIRHEDLTALSFEPGSMDAVVSLEVCEHIPDFSQAFAECARVLRPGGQFVLSVPFHRGPKHLTRARITPNGEIEHLEEPEYHGDPIDPAGCLCFHHFGWDILDHLKNAGFRTAKAVVIWSEELGYLENCGYQIMFVAEK